MFMESMNFIPMVPNCTGMVHLARDVDKERLYIDITYK